MNKGSAAIRAKPERHSPGRRRERPLGRATTRTKAGSGPGVRVFRKARILQMRPQRRAHWGARSDIQHPAGRGRGSLGGHHREAASTNSRRTEEFFRSEEERDSPREQSILATREGLSPKGQAMKERAAESPRPRAAQGALFSAEAASPTRRPHTPPAFQPALNACSRLDLPC